LAEDRIKQIVEIEAQLAGFDKSSKAVQQITKDLEAFKKTQGHTVKSQKQLQKAAENYAKFHKKQSALQLKAVEKSTKEWKKHNTVLGKSSKKIKAVSKELIGMAAGATTLWAILKNGVQELHKYNKAMLVTTASAAKYGHATKDVERALLELSTATGLSSEATMSLLNDYERSSRVFSMSGFEAMTKQIESVFGPSEDAIKQAQQAVVSFSNAAPGMRNAILNIASASEKEKKAIVETTNQLLIMGDLNLAQVKTIQDLVAGRDKSSEEMRKEAEAMNRMAEASKRIQRAIGKFLMPIIVELDKFIKENMDSIIGWGETIGNAVKEVLEWFKSIPRVLNEVKASFNNFYQGSVEKVTDWILWIRGEDASEAMRNRNRNMVTIEPPKIETPAVKDVVKQNVDPTAGEAEGNRSGQIEILRMIAAEYAKVKDAVVSRYQAEIDWQIRAGEVNEETVVKSYDNASKSIQKRIEWLKTEINLRKAGLQDKDEKVRASALADITNFTREITQLESERVSLLAQIGKQYQGIKDAAAAETSIAQARVQLLDNFAIGVGASAQARMEAFQFAGKELEIMQQELAMRKEAARAAGPRSEAAREVLKLEAQILQKQQQQAQMVKALRDGWISAIGAMNTGAGRFTKIMVSAQKNLNAGLSKFNMVVSNVSGSAQGGFASSERFSAAAPGVINRAKFGEAFKTDFGPGSAFTAEGKMRSAMSLGTQAQQAGQRASKGGFAGLSAAASPHLKSAFLGGKPGSTVNPSASPTAGGVRGSGGGGGGASGTNVNIPNLVITVNGTALDKLPNMIKNEVSSEIDKAIEQFSHGGNQAVLPGNRANLNKDAL